MLSVNGLHQPEICTELWDILPAQPELQLLRRDGAVGFKINMGHAVLTGVRQYNYKNALP